VSRAEERDAGNERLSWVIRGFLRPKEEVVSAVPVVVVLLAAIWFAILWWRLRPPMRP